MLKDKFKVGEHVLVRNSNMAYSPREIVSLEERGAHLRDGFYATFWLYEYMHKCPKSIIKEMSNAKR